MTPGRLRLLSLLSLAISVALTAVAAGAGGSFLALVLATVAAAFALLLAGPVFRMILAVLIALLGVCVILVAVATPEGGALVGLAVAGGALQVLIGIGIALTARAWPASGSRYSRTRVDGDATSDWDALSSGDDPTTRSGSVD
jgi:hypothetical protein